MFGWLSSLLSLFRPNERLLFGYWDGSKKRRMDPMVAWRGIHEHECRWAVDTRVANNPLKQDGEPFYPIEEVKAAEDRLLQMTRDVFGVKPWSENAAGLTIIETNELFTQFMLFAADLKKKRSDSPTTLPASDSMEPRPSVDSDGPPMSSASESISIATESSAAAPSGPERQSAAA